MIFKAFQRYIVYEIDGPEPKKIQNFFSTEIVQFWSGKGPKHSESVLEVSRGLTKAYRVRF